MRTTPADSDGGGSATEGRTDIDLVGPTPISSHRADLEYAEVGELGSVPLATIGGRVLARLVDLVLVGVPVLACVLFLPDELVTGWWRLVVLLPAFVVVATGYDALFTAKRGATPGKRVARITVVRLDTARPPGHRDAFVRAAVLLVPGVVPLLGQFVQFGCVLSAVMEERCSRGWHDRAAGTVVLLGSPPT